MSACLAWGHRLIVIGIVHEIELRDGGRHPNGLLSEGRGKPEVESTEGATQENAVR